MFFDRLFNLTSLKARLLGGTSFTQLYSAERLPLHKFRREGATSTPLIAGLLAACGGGHDRLIANGGNDFVFGGTGNDVLIGGRGADRLIGASGADVFVFEGRDYAPNERAPLPPGTPNDFDNFDRIMDYYAEDTIHFTDLAISSLSTNTSLLFQGKLSIILYGGQGAAHILQVQFADSNR